MHSGAARATRASCAVWTRGRRDYDRRRIDPSLLDKAKLPASVASAHAIITIAGAVTLPVDRIRLVATSDTIGPGGVALVTFEIVDAAGTVVPIASDLVHVSVTGGDLLALDNADLQDQSGYRTGQRHAFNGRGLAIVRATTPGIIRVEASADGLRSASITLRVVPGRATPSIPAAR